MLRQKSKRYLSEPTRKYKRINKIIFHRRNGISSVNKILNSNAKHSTNKASDCITINNVCRDCGKNFRSPLHLKNHFCNNASDKPLECKICRKTFRQLNNLKMHYRVHLPDVSLGKNSRNNLAKEKDFSAHLVESPKKQSTSNLSLNAIKPSNHPKKQFSIIRKYRTILRSACGIIKEKNHLVQHSDALLDDQSFSCSECKMLFKRKDHLQRHSRIHTGDKPFSCNVCNKIFSRKDHLKRHFLTHLSDKPFSCCKCMKVFKHKNYLTLHNRIHCKSIFPNAKNIKKKSEKVFKRKTSIKNLDDNRQDKSFASKARSKMLERTNRIRNTSGANKRDKSLSNEKCDNNSNYTHEVVSLGCSYSVSNSIESCIPEKIREDKHPKGQVCVDFADNPFNGIEKAVSPSDNLVIDAAISKNENSQDCCDGNKEYSNAIELKSKTVIEHPMYSHGINVHEVIRQACAFSVPDSTECCISEKVTEDRNHLEGQVCADITDNPSNGIENLKVVSPGDNLAIDSNISKNESSQDCCDGIKGYSNDIELKSNNVIKYPIYSHGGNVHEAISSACAVSERGSTECCIYEKIIDRNHLEGQVRFDLTDNSFNGIENLKAASPSDNLVIDAKISSEDCCDNTGHSNDIQLKSNNVIENQIYSYCGDIHEVVSSICTHSVCDSTIFCIPEKAIEYNEYPEWQDCFDLIEKTFNGIENLKAMLQDDNFVIDSNISEKENSQHCCDNSKGHPTDIQFKSKNVVEYTIICSYCGQRFKRHGDLQRHLRVHRLTLTISNPSSRIN